MDELPTLNEVMSKLREKRPRFHSEADFQFAFAWELQTLCPEAVLYLERPFPTPTGNIYVDIWVMLKEKILAIELKYKTRKIDIHDDWEIYGLKDQTANDFGRYDFIKDVCRLEYVKNAIPNAIGWAIMLTNDHGYWSEQARRDTADVAFKLPEGRILEGTLIWPERYDLKARKKREAPLVLAGRYSLSWLAYASNPNLKNGDFMYLPIQITDVAPPNSRSIELVPPVLPIVNRERIQPTVSPMNSAAIASTVSHKLPSKIRLLQIMRDGNSRNAAQWAILLDHGTTQTQQLIRDLVVDGHTIDKSKQGTTVYYALSKELNR